jgi:hypothetical protein
VNGKGLTRSNGVIGTEGPTLLFFHGNGEIVADYEDLGPLYASKGSVFPMDYREHGRSTGTPTVTTMSAIVMLFLLLPRSG